MRKPRADTDGHILAVHPLVTGNGVVGAFAGETYADWITWLDANGEAIGTAEYVIDVGADGETGTLRIEFSLDGRPVSQAFDLVTRPCRFGGRRWLAACPGTGCLVAKLYSAGDGLFRSRHAMPLAYRSQDRVPAREKLRGREVVLLERLGVFEGWEGLPPRPMRMRRSTYRRLADELQQVRSAQASAQARGPQAGTSQAPAMSEDPIAARRAQMSAIRARALAAGLAAARC